ncbi:hypothetical protein GW932_00430 [archaeon]|nr:hypothetical protein [archaeon]
MEEVIKILIGVLVLALGFPLGEFLKRLTLDEQVIGRKYFIILTYIGLSVGLLGLLFNRDWIMFTFFFIAIVTSRSLKK